MQCASYQSSQPKLLSAVVWLPPLTTQKHPPQSCNEWHQLRGQAVKIYKWFRIGCRFTASRSDFVDFTFLLPFRFLAAARLSFHEIQKALFTCSPLTAASVTQDTAVRQPAFPPTGAVCPRVSQEISCWWKALPLADCRTCHPVLCTAKKITAVLFTVAKLFLLNCAAEEQLLLQSNIVAVKWMNPFFPTHSQKKFQSLLKKMMTINAQCGKRGVI